MPRFLAVGVFVLAFTVIPVVVQAAGDETSDTKDCSAPYIQQCGCNQVMNPQTKTCVQKQGSNSYQCPCSQVDNGVTTSGMCVAQDKCLANNTGGKAPSTVTPQQFTNANNGNTANSPTTLSGDTTGSQSTVISGGTGQNDNVIVTSGTPEPAATTPTPGIDENGNTSLQNTSVFNAAIQDLSGSNSQPPNTTFNEQPQNSQSGLPSWLTSGLQSIGILPSGGTAGAENVAGQDNSTFGSNSGVTQLVAPINVPANDQGVQSANAGVYGQSTFGTSNAEQPQSGQTPPQGGNDVTATIYYPGCVGGPAGCSVAEEGGLYGSRNNYLDPSVPTVAAGYSSGYQFGQVLSITNPGNGQSVNAIVGDVCPSCGSGIDLTPAAASALGFTQDQGRADMQVSVVANSPSYSAGSDIAVALNANSNALNPWSTPTFADLPAYATQNTGILAPQNVSWENSVLTQDQFASLTAPQSYYGGGSPTEVATNNTSYPQGYYAGGSETEQPSYKPSSAPNGVGYGGSSATEQPSYAPSSVPNGEGYGGASATEQPSYTPSSAPNGQGYGGGSETQQPSYTPSSVPNNEGYGGGSPTQEATNNTAYPEGSYGGGSQTQEATNNTSYPQGYYAGGSETEQPSYAPSSAPNGQGYAGGSETEQPSYTASSIPNGVGYGGGSETQQTGTLSPLTVPLETPADQIPAGTNYSAGFGAVVTADEAGVTITMQDSAGQETTSYFTPDMLEGKTLGDLVAQSGTTNLENPSAGASIASSPGFGGGSATQQETYSTSAPNGQGYGGGNTETTASQNSQGSDDVPLPPSRPALPSNPSVVDYLDSINQNSSFSARADLAVQTDVVQSQSQYTGSAAQNTALLSNCWTGMCTAQYNSPVGAPTLTTAATENTQPQVDVIAGLSGQPATSNLSDVDFNAGYSGTPPQDQTSEPASGCGFSCTVSNGLSNAGGAVANAATNAWSFITGTVVPTLGVQTESGIPVVDQSDQSQAQQQAQEQSQALSSPDAEGNPGTSADPCNTASATYYNALECAQEQSEAASSQTAQGNPGTSLDPCDTASSYYNATECAQEQSAAASSQTSEGNPGTSDSVCDTASQSYDQTECAAQQAAQEAAQEQAKIDAAKADLQSKTSVATAGLNALKACGASGCNQAAVVAGKIAAQQMYVDAKVIGNTALTNQISAYLATQNQLSSTYNLYNQPGGMQYVGQLMGLQAQAIQQGSAALGATCRVVGC